MKNYYEVHGEKTFIRLDRKDGSHLWTVIDTEDLPKVMAYKGKFFASYDPCTDNFYVLMMKQLQDGRRTTLKLHRIITDCPKGMQVDHINHRTLDNTRENLRVCTQQDNLDNRRLKRRAG